MLLKKIKALASEKHTSLYAIEKQLGFSTNTIAKWDGHAPSVYRVKAVADLLGVTLDELVREEG